MGVTGLWKLIEPCGKPVPVETLEGKILAVDISIWLHQVVKGFQDNKGASLNNAHLLGLFHRLCKLMYYRVKPVFVFDGCVPQLKKDTIARRQQQRSKLNTEADRIQALLLQSLAKEKIVQQALGPNAEFLITSPIKKLAANKTTRKENELDDMFKLPELPSSSKGNANSTGDGNTDETFNENSFCSEDNASTSATDSSLDEANSRNAYNSNLQAIDVKSKEFLQLPADVRHEILVDIKETRKQSSWGRLHELPSKGDDFSIFQMKRLLKRHDVQVSLQSAEQEMGGRTLTYAELTNIFNEEGILETNLVEKGTKQITSDEHTRFLLVKDLKKKLSKLKEETEEIKEQQNSSATTSTENNKSSVLNVEDKRLGNEYDADLELAIALSLEDDSNKVYDEKDYEYDSDESLKLSKEQRQQLQNTAKGPARSYMIEYAGMNNEEVTNILEKTQAKDDFDDTLDITRLIGDTEKKDLKPIENESINTKSESQEIRLCVTDDSDATDSDLEEVKDEQNTSNDSKLVNVLKKIAESEREGIGFKNMQDSVVTNNNIKEVADAESYKNKLNIDLEDECVIEETPPYFQQEDESEAKLNTSKTLNIQIDLSRPHNPEEDIFADIFKDIAINNEILEHHRKLPEDTDCSKENVIISKLSEQVKHPSSAVKDLNAQSEINPSIMNVDKTDKILSILDELKQQADDIKNIKLENIKLGDSIIEISDDETALQFSELKNEVIEVCDSDDYVKRCSTPPAQITCSMNQSPNVNSKSPNFRTPSKKQAITQFFTVDYVVKRTPEKPSEDEKHIPSIKSPFFISKTPKSERKNKDNSAPSDQKSSKAHTILFEEESEKVSKDGVVNLNNDFMAIEETKTKSGEEILNEAANILKSKKTVEDLNTIALDLADERRELEKERNRQDRMGMSITQRMNSDCQDLLRLFGIPFIVAPMEAEAQCAFLDVVQLTNGTITDDSDIWLFGGRTVYKNFFAQNKHVMEFRSEQIERDFSCDRNKLIQLACLVGSDYTTGIHGIGAVTALEILASFAPKESGNKACEPTPTATKHILDTLQRFRGWWSTFKSSATPPGSSARLALQKKLKNIELYEGFPSAAVVEAYLDPKVDQNKEAFSWGYPDVESLREFTRKTFGWTTIKTDEILMPVLKKLDEKRTQKTIRNYFNVKNALSLRQIRVSKRVQQAIEKMSGNIDSDEKDEKPTKAKRAKKINTLSGRKRKEASPKPLEIEIKQVNNYNSTAEASCSNQHARGPVRITKQVNIPETRHVIPQRERDLLQRETNKKVAAEIFKNTATKTIKKRKK